MEALELLKQGDLTGALERQVAAVKKQPADASLRYNLAAMLVMRGELDRAETHLLAIGTLQADLAPAVSTYLQLLQSEEERRRVFAGAQEVAAPPDAMAAIAGRRELRLHLARGDAAAAGAAHGALPAATDRAGTIDGRAFRRFGDADEGLGPVLEVFATGRYLWWPLDGIRSMKFEAPRGLLDFLWAPCEFELDSGRTARAHVPVLYAGSLGHEDAAICRARRTEWVDEHGLVFRGLGQRLFAVDGDEVPLLEVREVRFS
ncbi:MAG: type VI secretion system accessory protein TagJ [Planctomycetota bacterium]